MLVERLSAAKHRVSVADVRLAEATPTNRSWNLLWRIVPFLAEPPNKLRAEPSHVAPNGEVSFDSPNHGQTRVVQLTTQPASRHACNQSAVAGSADGSATHK